MAGSLNKVTLIGNLGADPEVRTFQNGGKVCNISIATSEKWRDKNTGENREKTEWHTVAIFAEGLVRVCEQYLKKGSKVYIEGALQTRKWQDQSGNDKYSTEVVIQGFGGTLIMLDGRSGSDNAISNQIPNYSSGSGSAVGSSKPSSYDQGSQSMPNPSDLDDEIPF